MKYIDMDNWNRKEHFNHFTKMDFPQFNVCNNVDITEYLAFIKENKIPFFISMLYIVTKTANEVKEFRYRIRDGKVIEHEVVSPSYTVMGEDEVFGFGMSDFEYDFEVFRERAEKDIEYKTNNISLEFDATADQYIYMTCLPWISFTGVSHPMHFNPAGSVPMFAWGKYFKQEERTMMPFSIQAHHGLIDGFHVGKYIMILQDILNNPGEHLK